MAGRGGSRPGAGPRSKALKSAIAATGETDLALALTKVIDDVTIDIATRLEACRYLAGACVARVISEYQWAA